MKRLLATPVILGLFVVSVGLYVVSKEIERLKGLRFDTIPFEGEW